MAFGGEPDPLAQFARPPPDEAPAERAKRLQREAEAQRISDQIDEQIKQDKVLWNKQKEMVKVLLLGQSESGKSTTLKNFRLAYARKEWEAEKISWRAVIQLNLIRSITTIMDTIQAEMDGEPLKPLTDDTEAERVIDSRHVQGRVSTDLSTTVNSDVPPPPAQSGPPETHHSMVFSESQKRQIQTIKLRLAPLRRTEAELKRRLGAGTEEVTSMESEGEDVSQVDQKGFNPGATNGGTNGTGSPERFEMRTISSVRHRKSMRFRVQGEETFVWGSRWKEILSSGLAPRRNSLGLVRNSNGHGGVQGGEEQLGMGQREDVGGDATEVIAGCREEMKMLWTDGTVQRVLKKRNVHLEDGAGFFLDDIDRIATHSYLPSDDDVVRSRLRTLGVQEYRINLNPNTGPGQKYEAGLEWVIYDVGGSRTARRAWLPYFEGVNAIIFLAPISCFNEQLLEDPSINRLNDSLALWRAINTSKLLQTTTMICFLNKCDILKRKLKSGVLFRDYVRGFPAGEGEEGNDLGSVVRFIKERFKDIAIKHSPQKRTTYLYTTSVTDTKATATTLRSVKDSILRQSISNAHLV